MPFELRDPRTRRKILAVLNRTEGVAAISNQILLQLIEASELRHFEPGSTVWQQGQLADALWVLLDGAVTVTGQSHPYEIAAGQAIGIDAVLHGYDWASTGSAMTLVVALRIPRVQLHQLASQSTALRRALRRSAEAAHKDVPTFVTLADEANVEHVMVAVPSGWSESHWVRALARVWTGHLSDKLAVVIPDPSHVGPPQLQAGTPQVVVVCAEPEEAQLQSVLDLASLGYLLVDGSRCRGPQLAIWRGKANKVVAWHDGAAQPEMVGFGRHTTVVTAVRVPGAQGPLASSAVRLKLAASDLSAAPSPVGRWVWRGCAGR